MVKQRNYPGGKCYLPTISEEGDPALWQRDLINTEQHPDEINTLQVVKTSDNYRCSGENPKETVCQEIAKTKDVIFSPMHIFSEDSRELTKHHMKTSKLEDMNQARALFPDFFPRSTTQDSCDDFWWRAKPTMEQLFSGQNNEFSNKCFRHDSNFEYWKKHQLSF